MTDDFANTKLSVMGLLGVTEVAGRLGVTTRQVQHLVARGDLHALARGVIDETSVERYLSARQGSRRRAWSETTAWGAVALLSHRDAGWMGEAQRSRLRARLRTLGPEELVSRARQRAAVARYAGHTSTTTRLRTEIVDTSRAAESLGLAAATSVDGYVAVEDVDALVARHGLMRNDDGRITLRATAMHLAVVTDLADAGTVLAALDLAESLNIREHRVGLDALADALGRFRG